MTVYILRHPNKNFSGTFFGIGFHKGRGSTNSSVDKNRLVQNGCRDVTQKHWIDKKKKEEKAAAVAVKAEKAAAKKKAEADKKKEKSEAPPSEEKEEDTPAPKEEAPAPKEEEATDPATAEKK